MDAFARQFGAKIKQTRTERGMTQAELAAAAEVGPNYVPRIERGEMTPSVDAAFRLSRALGLTLDDLCSPKAKRDPFGSATRQLAALSDTDLAGMKRTLEAVETVRKALREPGAASSASKPTKEASPRKRANLVASYRQLGCQPRPPGGGAQAPPPPPPGYDPRRYGTLALLQVHEI